MYMYITVYSVRNLDDDLQSQDTKHDFYHTIPMPYLRSCLLCIPPTAHTVQCVHGVAATWYRWLWLSCALFNYHNYVLCTLHFMIPWAVQQSTVESLLDRLLTSFVTNRPGCERPTASSSCTAAQLALTEWWPKGPNPVTRTGPRSSLTAVSELLSMATYVTAASKSGSFENPYVSQWNA